MIKNFFNFKKQKETIVLDNPPEKELEDLFQNLNNFSSLIKKSSNKNLILKDFDILDLKIIEFINKHGRNSYYGKKAVEFSKQLSEYYSFFRDNIHLYLDEPVSQIKKEEPKIDLDAVYSDLRKRLNSFKESINQGNLTEDEIENFILLFNDEIKELMKLSDKDYKFKFIELKNKLISFYKQLQKKEDQEILEINNKMFEIKEKYLETKEIIETKLSGKEKDSFLKKLNAEYNQIDSLYINYIEKLASLETEISEKIEIPEKQFSITLFEVLKSFKPNPILKLRENKEKLRKKQQAAVEQTINILTEVLNNAELYETEELKQIFTNNFQVYEKFILNTDYSLLVKSLLDDLEDNISKLDEEKKFKIKRDSIAKDSYNFLKHVNSSLQDYSIEELQVIFEKNLENYKTYSKYTIFGLKINNLLNRSEEH